MAFKLVIDADGSKYFDSILHARLMAVLAERIVDGALLHIIRMWLKAPVMGEDEVWALQGADDSGLDEGACPKRCMMRLSPISLLCV